MHINNLPSHALLACVIALYSCTSPSDKAENPVEPVNIYNGDVKIDYKSYGNGEIAVLFVHGWCINQTYWDSQVDALKSDYQVITMDLPGFGQSGMNKEKWTIEGYGEDVNALIDQLKLSNVVLVGHSMGGNVILESAVKNRKVIALIGVDNFKDVGSELTPEVQEQVDAFMVMLQENFKEIAPAYAEGSLFHSSTDSLVKKRVMEDFASSNPESAIGSLKALLDYGVKEQTLLSQLEQPLYLINSNASPTSREGLDSLGVSYQVLDIDSTGHYPMIEKPEVFNELLKKVLDRIEVKSQTISQLPSKNDSYDIQITAT
ncbi:Pimeloyl-ACP methyl ester carboxylesterase [Ekhidna lutea]|uniref:Pimeloyl-ACP methyl ester carboxylesterase n=1 Tax=Ekhidna lutea TaxID=447679 RepID=A0A239LE37_EKHLU|nr:alpha/beta hydrolase [Ekhidna lutea]SNT28168.1 Pimeloyl-ACP methyl ester carboxylesterase [Ekhidna lutea]